MVGALIRATVAVCLAVFYRLERRGPPVPGGPVLIVANHPNSLLDPLVLFRTSGRLSRPLARAPLFEMPVLGTLIRAVGAIPVYRPEDDPALVGRNRDTLRAASAALADGAAIQMFPEGRTHSDPAIARLRTGAARIALGAEAERDWGLGVAIVPVGLTYARKALFQSHVVAVYGEPVPVAPFRREFERDESRAVRSLTAEIDGRLRALTLELSRWEDEDLIHAAERLWSLGKGLRTSRQRVPLAERLPRLQAFARGLAWLRAHDPDRHRALEARVRRYQRITAVLGAGEADVPDRYRVAPGLHWVLLRGLPLVLLAPIAIVGFAAFGIPYLLVRRYVRRRDLPPEVVATYKVGAGMVAHPMFLGIWCALAAWFLGWRFAVALAVVLPLSGVITARWLEQAREARQDLRLLLRLAAPRTRGARDRRMNREHLAAERAALTSEFDSIRDLMEAGTGPDPADQSRPFG